MAGKGKNVRVICQKTILFGLLLSLLLPTGPILGQADANPDDIDMQQLYFEIYTERSLAGVKGSSALRDVRDNYAQRLNKLISDFERDSSITQAINMIFKI